jgi:hypothetical protein
LVETLEIKWPLGRKDNIKVDVMAVSCESMDRTYPTQTGHRSEGGCCDYGNEHSDFIKHHQFLDRFLKEDLCSLLNISRARRLD